MLRRHTVLMTTILVCVASQLQAADLDNMRATIARLEEKTTLDLIDAPIKDVLEALEKIHKIKFAVRTEGLLEKRMSADIVEAPLHDVLRHFLNRYQAEFAVLPSGEIVIFSTP